MLRSGGVREQTSLSECGMVIQERVGGEKLHAIIHIEVHEVGFLPYLPQLTCYPSRRLLHLFPYELANEYRCVPVGIERGAVTLATGHCLASDILTRLQKHTHKRIFQVRCADIILDELLHYWRGVLLA